MRRVVVTGVGTISPIGNSFPEFSRSLLAGISGVGQITHFSPDSSGVKIAAEVKHYDEAAYFNERQLTQLDRFAQFTLISADEAISDAGLVFDEPTSLRTTVVHGSSIGGQNTQEINYRYLYEDKIKRFHPFTIPKLMPSAGASHISMRHGIKGPVFSTSSACASAAHAIGLAFMLIRTGIADTAVAGGAEACITYGSMKGWASLRITAADACRPFSAGRGGMVIGEGAASLILEDLDKAQARGAKIYAELVGFGMSADAGALVQPDVDGAVRSMRMALNDAGLCPEQVQYINAHGTGTPQNDPSETRAIREVFGHHASKLAVSSSKSMHGHTLGAASALESLSTIVALTEQRAPPTINYLGADPTCDLDYVPNVARQLPIEAALNNSFAFGGLNATLAFKRFS